MCFSPVAVSVTLIPLNLHNIVCFCFFSRETDPSCICAFVEEGEEYTFILQ